MKHAYTAATDMDSHDRSFLGDVYRLETCAAPEAAIWKSKSAESTSRVVKTRTLTMQPIQVDGEGSREKSGNNSGACKVSVT